MIYQQLMRCGAFTAALLVGGSPAIAQTLHDFIAAAAVRNPDLAALEGRGNAIGARQRAAGSWAPAPPTITAGYSTDQVFRDRRQRDATIGISTPLWLPGEGTASQRVANTEKSRLSAQIAVVTLKIAGQVRDALADFAIANAELAVAELRLRDGRSLENDTARRVKARDASEANLLLAKAERIAADGEVREKRTVLAQARIEFDNLTGMAPVMAALDDKAPIEPNDPIHPRLDDAQGALEVARANQALAEIQTRDSPEIALIARRSRDTFGTVYNNSLGVEIKIPFSSEARNAPRQAMAQAEFKEAMALRMSAEREVVAERLKARLAYDNALVQRDLASERAKTLTQQVALVSRGQTGGEVTFSDFIRARTLFYEAEAAKARAVINVSKARGRLNQSLGMIP
jgi:cobalt-zinc-cadmium efflux system outer membrane protein